jgi:hypothetical protein
MVGSELRWMTMPSEAEAVIRGQLVLKVYIAAHDLRRAIELARADFEGSQVDDEVILERINECLSEVGFLVIRKPRSKASFGTDPWER